MMNSLPLVSIVLPAYNHGKYLHEAIQSVLSQSYSNVELLVFDDGSTDNTAEILATYGKQFYWERHNNMGQSATLNKGWQMSTGEIISYLSADDALEPNAVEMAVKCLHHDNDAVLAYGDYLLVDAESKVIERVYAPEFDYSEMVANIVVQPGPGVFFRRYAFEKIGGWNESLCQIPDYEYWLRLGILGHFTRIPKSLARYRVHEESQSYIEPTIEKSEECVHVMHEFFENENISSEIKILEPKAKSMAHLIAARFHLRAGRYKGVVRSLEKAWNWRARSILSIRMIRLLGNGLLFRMKRLMLQK